MTTLTATVATTPAVRTDRTHRRLVRAASIGAAAVATTTLFGLGRAAGADMTIAVGGAAPAPFVPTEIAVATVVIGLVGWAVLALLERFSRHAHRIWVTLAVLVVGLSMAPIWMVQARTGTRVTLVCIHLAVGAALLPFLKKPA